MFCRKLMQISALGVMALAAIPAQADVVYTFNATAVGAYGAGPYGTVTLHESGGNVNFTVNLRPDMDFINTGNAHELFSFNAFDVATTDITNVLFHGTSLAQVLTVTGGTNSPYGVFTLGFDCTGDNSLCPGGGSSPGFFADPLTFTVLNAQYSDFGILSGLPPASFGADVINCIGVTSNCTTGTGSIAVTGPGISTPNEVPEPLTMSLFASGLAAIAFLRRRRLQAVKA